MKSLNLARPLVLMVVGSPGAGKTFFARQFSETFNAPVVSFDRLRFELLANPTYNNDENDLIGRVAAYQIEELLKTKRSFVVDGGCNSKVDRLRLTNVAKKANYDISAIWVQTDLNTSRARALRRNPDKHLDDQFSHSITNEIFERLVRKFTTPDHERHIVISGKHTYNTQVKMVLRKLTVSREASAEDAHRNADITPRPENDQTRRSRQRPETYRRSVIIR